MERHVITRPTIAEWVTKQSRARSFSRRSVLGGLGTLGGLTLLGCSGGGGSGTTTAGATSGTTGGTTTTGTTTTTTTTSAGSCVLIPEETVGPYPLFNDIASAATYQRDDITEGKTGVPLKLTLSIVNVNNQCAPILTAIVYVWHCDKDGYYSGYSQRGADLRGQTFLAACR